MLLKLYSILLFSITEYLNSDISLLISTQCSSLFISTKNQFWFSLIFNLFSNFKNTYTVLFFFNTINAIKTYAPPFLFHLLTFFTNPAFLINQIYTLLPSLFLLHILLQNSVVLIFISGLSIKWIEYLSISIFFFGKAH